MTRLTTHENLLHRDNAHHELNFGVFELPEWLLRLPGVVTIVEVLGPQEFRRRLVHMSPALLPIALPFVPHRDVWGPALMSLLAFVTIAGLYVALNLSARVIRTTYENWTTPVLGYAVPIVSALLFLPGKAEIGLMTLQIVALGDGSATIGGLMLGGWKLPWNSKKTISGLCCFVIVGTLAATYSYWGEAHPVVPVATAFSVCLVTAIVAGLVESLPIRSNDNLRVGITSVVIGYAMTLFLV